MLKPGGNDDDDDDNGVGGGGGRGIRAIDRTNEEVTLIMTQLKKKTRTATSLIYRKCRCAANVFTIISLSRESSP